VTAGATRQRTVYTGDQYLESLRDGREVWIDGERVADVTAHPAFRNAARSVARLYDAMHDPEDSQVLLGVDNRGIETHRFFMPSYTTDGQARLPLRAAGPGLGGQRHQRLPRRSGSPRGADGLAKPDLVDHLDALPRDDARSWGQRGPEDRVRGLDPPVRHPGVRSRSPDLHGTTRRGAADGPLQLRDMLSEELRPVLDRYYRGTDSDAHDRIKLFKLIWDAMGSEFGGRHGWYEVNYSGNQEQMRLDMLRFSGIRGISARQRELVDTCLADYDVEG
jgi:hypothetical protein